MDIASYIKGLAPELQERAFACGSVEELLALAKEEKVALPDEALAAIAGGDGGDPENCAQPTCPNCGSHNIEENYLQGYHRCKHCGYEW